MTIKTETKEKQMMTMSIDNLREIVNILQGLIDEADNRDVTEVKMNYNTYGLYNFIGCGSSGYLDLDKDIDELLVDDEW